MKVLISLALLCGLVANADAGFNLNSVVTSRLLVPGESVGEFTTRIRAEISCLNLRDKLVEYRESLQLVNHDVRQSYGHISDALHRWDAELYRVSGRPFRYTGALGTYAGKVTDYASGVATNHAKLEIFVATYEAKLGECLALSQQPQPQPQPERPRE